MTKKSDKENHDQRDKEDPFASRLHRVAFAKKNLTQRENRQVTQKRAESHARPRSSGDDTAKRSKGTQKPRTNTTSQQGKDI